jgi:hypothetical protein
VLHGDLDPTTGLLADPTPPYARYQANLNHIGPLGNSSSRKETVMRRLVLMLFCSALGLASLGLAAQPALAADLCVGAKPGCFQTIQAAVDVAHDGSSAVALNGGLEVFEGFATVRNSLIRGNRVSAVSTAGAFAGGGGVGNYARATLERTLERTLVIGDSVSATGAGGLSVSGILNATVGGPPQLTLTDSVVTANDVSASPGIALQGGGIFTDTAIASARSVVAGNQPDQCFGR